MKNENNEFSYTYSAREKEEAEKIRRKYQEKKESKIEKLRRMDSKVTSKAMSFSMTIGIIGALIMGFGMSLIMTDLGKNLLTDELYAMVIGIIIGVVGIGLVISAYPVYNNVVKNEREKIAPEILKLTDELMK